MWDETSAVRYATIESLRPNCETHEFDNHPELVRLRDSSRRTAWIAGRVLAVRLLRKLRPEWSDAAIDIRSRNAAGQGISPEVFVDAVKQDISLSISHTDRGVLVAASQDMTVGVDLVDCEQFSAGKLTPWFTEGEQQLLAESANAVRDQAIIWGVKEAVYKAVDRGESFAPKSLEAVQLSDDEWTCRYRDLDSPDCRIHITDPDGHIAILAVMSRWVIQALRETTADGTSETR